MIVFLAHEYKRHLILFCIILTLTGCWGGPTVLNATKDMTENNSSSPVVGMYSEYSAPDDDYFTRLTGCTDRGVMFLNSLLGVIKEETNMHHVSIPFWIHLRPFS